jgi:hypothetical protein
MLMVEPIEPFPVRQTIAGGCQVVSFRSVKRVTIDGGAYSHDTE